MKNISKILIIALVLIVPIPAYAADFRGGEDLSVRENVQGDLYFGAANTFLSHTVQGDAVGVSGNFSVSGDVQDDLLVVAGTVQMIGNVGDDARLAGGTVMVHGKIGGDLVSGAGQMYIGPDTVVEGDAVLAGGRVSLEGTIKGDMEVYAEEVTINGRVEGNVDISGSKIQFGNTAVVEGNVSYTSKKEAVIEEGAQILGSVDFEKQEYKGSSDHDSSGFWGWIFGVWILKLLAWTISSIILVLLLKKRAEAVTETALSGFWKEAGRGFLVLVATPIAAILLLVTVVGIPLGALLLLGYGFSILVAKMLAGVVAGTLIFRLAKKGGGYKVSWVSVLVGTLVISLIALIPVVGWIVVLLFFLAGLGAGMKHCYEKVWK